MPWILLLFAGLLEIVWVVAMKQTAGFTRLWPTAIMGVAMIGSFGLLAMAMRDLPLGTAYTIWTGIGAVGAFTVGVLFLGEALTMRFVLAAVLVIAGVVLSLRKA